MDLARSEKNSFDHPHDLHPAQEAREQLYLTDTLRLPENGPGLIARPTFQRPARGGTGAAKG